MVNFWQDLEFCPLFSFTTFGETLVSNASLQINLGPISRRSLYTSYHSEHPNFHCALSKINHELVNLSFNCDVKSGLRLKKHSQMSVHCGCNSSTLETKALGI